MDILPTICRAIGIRAPYNIDGKDISTLLTGLDTTIKHDTLVWDTQHEVAVRAGNWKWHLVKGKEHAIYEMVDLELGEYLYNLETDLAETINLADQYPEIVFQLKQYHKRWLEEMSDPVN